MVNFSYLLSKAAGLVPLHWYVNTTIMYMTRLGEAKRFWNTPSVSTKTAYRPRL